MGRNPAFTVQNACSRLSAAARRTNMVFVAQINRERNVPFTRRSYAIATVIGVPSRVKRLRMAART